MEDTIQVGNGSVFAGISLYQASACFNPNKRRQEVLAKNKQKKSGTLRSRFSAVVRLTGLQCYVTFAAAIFIL